MTIYVQYYKNGGFQSLPPPPTVNTGQTVGARLAVHNDHPDGQTKTFIVKKAILNPSGSKAAYEEESQNLSYGQVGFFPITTSNTPKAGNYLGDFKVYIGSSLWANWNGNPNLSPEKLIAIAKAVVVPPDEEPPVEPPEDGTPSDGIPDVDWYWKVGEANVKSLDELNQYQAWNNNFKAGDYGIIKMKFPVPIPSDLPNWLATMLNPFGLLFKEYNIELSKAGISDYLNSYLPAKGVQLWKPVYWESSYLCIPFITGIAPLVIVAIAVGVALVVSAVLIPVALWKVGIAYVQAEKEKEIEGQDQILKTISGIEDPELQAKILLEYLGMKAAGESNESIWEKLFEKPVLIVGITIAVCLAAFVAIKLIRR